MQSPSQAVEPGVGSTRLRRWPRLPPAWVRRARPVLGTVVEISVADRRPARQLHAALDVAFACVERIHHLMSFQMPDSELRRLNREAAQHPLVVDPHTYAVFETALRVAALSEGAFDPCVAPRLEDWGLLPRADSPCDPLANWRDIELLPGARIRYARPLRVDLSGIAKGYAVDLAVESLQANGLAHIVVNAGGDLRVAGPDAHRVRLRSPLQPLQSANELALCNAALATSANYFSRRTTAMGPVSALVNPFDGSPYSAAHSVSVRAPRCMIADALTKVVLFAPRAIAETVLARFDARAYVI